MNDAQHFVIVSIGRLVDIQYLLVMLILIRLVKDAQYLVKTVVYLAVKTRYLDDDAVMGKAVDKRIGKTLCHHFVVIVVRMAAHIEDGLLDVTHLMP